MAPTTHYSKACERCRARRLKCDYGRPGCRKCIHAGVECPGYRKEQDILFQDQTQKVVAKLTGKPELASSLTSSLQQEKSVSDEEAIAYLLNNYLRRSSFDYVGSIYHASSPTSLFRQTTRATALAAYSLEVDKPELLGEAREIYGDALIRLRNTLATDPPNDEVLATVLLMSRFETLSKTSDETAMSQTWSNHVIGAFDLVCASHTQESLLSRYSLHLVTQTVHNYNMYCLRKSQKRSKTLQHLVRYVSELDDRPLSAMRLKFHAFTDAYSAYSTCRDDGNKNRVELIDWAMELDEQCVTFIQELGLVSKYDVVNLTEHSTGRDSALILHGTTYHIYADHFAARLWNTVRILRLALFSDICESIQSIRQSPSGCPPDVKQGHSAEHLDYILAKSWQTCLSMARDVCASAPQFLRYRGHLDCTAVAGCFLAWPLYTAGCCASEECGAFVIERLEWIGRELKIQAASIAAESLRKGEKYRDGWLYACYMF